MSETPKPSPGPTIKEISGRIGKYEIVKPLGKGAMGIVYLAHDTILERDVALKVMVAQIADDPELNDRFKREAKAVARMAHPNVVNVFDLGSHTDGSPYIAMELLKGMDLQKAIRQPPPMSTDRKVAIIVQVLAGLAHAHEAGIVHRDIKPANIFINHDGTVKIMDFGVARLTTASMTGTGNIVGTADYMSPEQVKGAKVDGRSDLFSVGCMLYELLAGQRPFHSDNLMAIFYKITHEEADFSHIPAGPEFEALMPVIQKALAKKLDDRYQNAYEFASDLREYLKMYATSASGKHALEQLLDIAPPSSTPTAADSMGPTVVGSGDASGATMDMGPRPGTSPGGRSATMKAGAATAAPRVGGTSPGMKTTVMPGAQTGRTGATRLSGGPRPAAREGVNPMVWVGVVVALAAVGGGAYFYLKPPVPEKIVTNPTPAPPESTAATAAPAASAPTAPPPAATMAPLGEVKGKAATYLKAAHAAMGKGDYDRAMEQAQSALREEPDNTQAQQIVDNALQGQKAQGHFRKAEDAVRQGAFEDAEREANAGRGLAPWDNRGPSLLTRIHEARQKAEQARAAEAQKQQQAQQAEKTAIVSGYLSKAASEIQADRYDAAIALYDEALKVDPSNQTALNGKTNAVVAKKMSEAAAGRGPAGGGKAFVAGKSTAQTLESRTGKDAGAAPPGFEDTAGVVVKRGSQAADLAGKLLFEVDPAVPRAGDKFTVRIQFANEGNASIQINDVLVTTIVDGRKMSGPVPVTVKEVAPHQKETILALTDFWKDVQSWSMEAVLRTVRGETYKNQVTWR
jgi:serine/threonine-protein kinase